MSGGRDDDDRGERPKLSWSELDKRRDRPRSHTDERRPRGAAAEARATAAAQSYLKQVDRQLFAKGGRGAAPRGRLADAVRDALGTPVLDDACRAYLAQAGPPADAALVAAFLDARDRDVRRAALDALAAERGPDRVALTPGLRSQLRVVAGGSDDELAELAEEILGTA